jgi:hypothetical protein
LFYRVKAGTVEYNLIVEFNNDRLKWSSGKILERAREILGTNSNPRISCDANRLHLHSTDLELMSEEVKSQFSKRDRNNCHDAKKNSKINREWVSFCKALGLKRIGFTDLLFRLGGSWIFYTPIKLQEMFDEFYFECSSQSISKEECLEKISEHEYYTIKANWSKEYPTNIKED